MRWIILWLGLFNCSTVQTKSRFLKMESIWLRVEHILALITLKYRFGTSNKYIIPLLFCRLPREQVLGFLKLVQIWLLLRYHKEYHFITSWFYMDFARINNFIYQRLINAKLAILFAEFAHKHNRTAMTASLMHFYREALVNFVPAL